MSSPCETNDCLDAATISKYTWFKWLVPLLGLLLCLPLAWWVAGQNTGSSVAAGVTPTVADSSAAVETDSPETVATEEPEATEAAEADTNTTTVATAETAALSLNPPSLGEFTLGAGSLAIGALALDGTGQPEATIQISEGDAVIGDVSIDEDGAWTFEDELERAPGTYDLAVRMLDADGTVLDEATTRIVVPEVSSAMADLTVGDPQIGNFVPAATAGLATGAIGLSGAGEPGTELEIRRDGELVDTVTIDADGNWSFDEEVDLTPGTYQYQARMLDADGNVLSEATTEVVIPEVEALPEPPTLTLSGGAAAGGEIELSGTAAPGSEVEILQDGQVIDTVTADEDGNWRYTTELSPGDYEFSARIATADGSTLVSDSTALSLAAPIATGPVILGTNATVAGVSLPGFYGEGRPGTTLEILQDGQVVGGATVREDGTWSCRCQLAPGNHTLTIQERGDPGTESLPVTLNVESLAPAFDPPRRPADATPDPNRPRFTCPDPIPAGEIQGTLYRVAPCETYGLIAARLGTTVNDLIAFNPQVPDPSRIYEGQLLNIPSDASCFDEIE